MADKSIVAARDGDKVTLAVRVLLKRLLQDLDLDRQIVLANGHSLASRE